MCSRMSGSASSGNQACCFDHCSEGVGIDDGKIGKNLAIKFDVGLFQAADQTRIIDSIHACGRAETGDPQASEITFLGPSVPIAETECAINGLGSGPEQTALAAPVSTSLFEYFISSAACFKTASYA